MIKVNVSMLGRKPGDIVKDSDKDFETFKGWAERGDRKGGIVLCQFMEAGSRAVEPATATLEVSTPPVISEVAIPDATEPNRMEIIAKLKEKGVKFFPGVKTEVLLAKLKEAGE